eukprot:689575-Pelagomonas_calceolata.AAC.2
MEERTGKGYAGRMSVCFNFDAQVDSLVISPGTSQALDPEAADEFKVKQAPLKAKARGPESPFL